MSTIDWTSREALIVVDVQNDFLPGGALPVPGGNEVIPPLNRYLAEFVSRGAPVFATRDWHPPDHCSFQPRGGPWPVHCVGGTQGAEFARDLELPDDVIIVSKGTRADQEAYSGFQGTDLETRLRDKDIERVWIGGLATDYCVRATVIDALTRGFSVLLLVDAIRAVDAEPGDGDRAIEEMCRRGARAITLEDLLP